MRKRFAVGLVVVAGLFGGGVEASHGPSCSGEAPVEFSCERTVTLARDVRRIEVLAPTGYLEASVSGHSWQCVNIALSVMCQGAIGPALRAGQTVTIEATVVGAGAWRVKLVYKH